MNSSFKESDPTPTVALSASLPQLADAAEAHFLSTNNQDLTARAKTASQLGMAPAVGPCIMTGHQAAFWHAGILAKYLATDHITSLLKPRFAGASNAHVVVDHDSNAPHFLAYPTQAGRSSAGANAAEVSPRRGRVELSKAAARTPAVFLSPLLSQPLAPLLNDLTIPQGAREGLASIATVLKRHSDAPDAPKQIVAGLHDLLTSGPVPLCEQGTAIFATSLHKASTFESLIQEIASDARACIQAYNDAVVAFPRARIAPLRCDASAIALPLWRLDAATMAREQVYAHELIDNSNITFPFERCAPKALLLTLFLRRFACDLFVHGAGGGLYDQITNRWIATWRPAWRLAPTAVISATLHLPFTQTDALPTPADISSSQWKAHASLHNPALLGDEGMASTKLRFRDAIAATKGKDDAATRLAFKEMHAWLAVYREAHEQALATIEERAGRLANSAAAADVVYDRTWPFVYHSRESLLRLRSLLLE